MILKEAYIENFGKLHKEEIVFRPGINVICGGNEAGKTTLAEFLSAMLFGLEPKRGRNQKNDAYRRYEPWNAASYYCGSLRFEIEDRPFVLKRNFYHKEKTAELKNEADGEQLSVEFGDLSMLLGELGRSAYENTWCIGQTGAVTGGIAVIDLEASSYLGRIVGLKPNVRHLICKDGYLYASINTAGYVQRTEMTSVYSAIAELDGKSKTARINGWESCKVFPGARTIVASPDGRFIFAACNFSSRIAVVETKTMSMIGSVRADSYPVGLAITRDGHYLFSTSQGNSSGGGNAVDIYRIEYK